MSIYAFPWRVAFDPKPEATGDALNDGLPLNGDILGRVACEAHNVHPDLYSRCR